MELTLERVLSSAMHCERQLAALHPRGVLYIEAIEEVPKVVEVYIRDVCYIWRFLKVVPPSVAKTIIEGVEFKRDDTANRYLVLILRHPDLIHVHYGDLGGVLYRQDLLQTQQTESQREVSGPGIAADSIVG